ncbi:MAG: hypothetical protein AMJ79_07240 [Phycisphaerae bacterium SM23_30]|nr:MAG: hypothetical protein AMJ79_07240 [Phycisphaerae bacterium SM23_30]
MKNKILLILPPVILPSYGKVFITEPLGIAYVGAVLEQLDYQVKIVDSILRRPGFDRMPDGRKYYGLSCASLKEEIAAWGPDMVGVSSMYTASHEVVEHIFQMIKHEINPEIITLCGGAHPTVCPEGVLSDENVDYVVLGEAEQSTGALLDAINGRGHWADIDGIGYKVEGRIVVNPKTRFIEELDDLPYPGRHLLDMAGYFGVSRRHSCEKVHINSASLLTSRSCPGRCIFCSARRLMGKYRKRSVQNVLEEIEHLIDRYQIKRALFFDDNFNFDKERTKKLLKEMIRRRYGISWFSTNLTLYKLDFETLELMQQSGCEEIDVSIESPMPSTLKLMRKPLQPETVEPLIKKMKELGFPIAASFVIGIPGETADDIRYTIEYARSLELDYCAFSIATPHLGTELHEICRKNNYFVDDFDYRDLQFGTGVIKTDQFDPAFLEHMRKWGWEQANFIDKGLPVPPDEQFEIENDTVCNASV